METESMVNEKLLLNTRAAAQALSVSERTLWQLTAPRGPIRAIRIGKSVRYSPRGLQEFVDQQMAGAQK